MGLKAFPLNLQPQFLGFLARGDIIFYNVHMHIIDFADSNVKL